MARFILLVFIVLLVIWFVRNRSGASRPPASRKRGASEPMLRCALCGAFMPQADALPGRGGAYCGEAHRTEHELQLSRQ